MKPNRFLRDPIFDLVEEEVWTPRGRSGLVQIFIACYRQHPIAPVAAHAVRVGKLECRYREKRLLRKAGRDRLGSLHKCQSRGMGAKELLNSIRMRPRRIRGNQRVDEVQEFFRSACWKGVDRMSDDVGMN